MKSRDRGGGATEERCLAFLSHVLPHVVDPEHLELPLSLLCRGISERSKASEGEGGWKFAQRLSINPP